MGEIKGLDVTAINDLEALLSGGGTAPAPSRPPASPPAPAPAPVRQSATNTTVPAPARQPPVSRTPAPPSTPAPAPPPAPAEHTITLGSNPESVGSDDEQPARNVSLRSSLDSAGFDTDPKPTSRHEQMVQARLTAQKAADNLSKALNMAGYGNLVVDINTPGAAETVIERLRNDGSTPALRTALVEYENARLRYSKANTSAKREMIEARSGAIHHPDAYMTSSADMLDTGAAPEDAQAFFGALPSERRPVQRPLPATATPEDLNQRAMEDWARETAPRQPPSVTAADGARRAQAYVDLIEEYDKYTRSRHAYQNPNDSLHTAQDWSTLPPEYRTPMTRALDTVRAVDPGASARIAQILALRPEQRQIVLRHLTATAQTNQQQ